MKINAFPSSWLEVAFSEFAEFPPRISLKKEEEFSFIPMENINADNKFAKSSATKKYTGGGAKFCIGDTLFARITPCLENGKIAQVKDLATEKGFGSTEYFVFRGREGISDSGFIYYYAKTPWFRQNAVNSMVGASGRQRADARFVGQTKLNFPSLSTQKKITYTLSAYDNLIENNLERIKLLEEMAHLTYEEWFVSMKFPGYEAASVNGGAGLPEGWINEPLSDAISINPKTKFIKSVSAPFVPMGALATNSMVVDRIEERAPSGGAKFIQGDTLFARITPCLENGKTGFIDFLGDGEVASGSTEFIVLRETEKVNRYFIYCMSRSDYFRQISIRSMVGSDGRQRVNLAVYQEVNISVPTREVMKQFEDEVRPVFDCICLLTKQIRILKEARDVLLPRLMTGVINVEGIESPPLNLKGFA